MGFLEKISFNLANEFKKLKALFQAEQPKEKEDNVIKNKQITRWVLEFIPLKFKKYLESKDCLDVNITINQLENYKMDDNVGRSIYIKFEFDRLNKDKAEDLLDLLEIDKIADDIKVKVINTCEKYNKSRNKQYNILNYEDFTSYCSFERKKRYQADLRLFTGEEKSKKIKKTK